MYSYMVPSREINIAEIEFPAFPITATIVPMIIIKLTPCCCKKKLTTGCCKLPICGSTTITGMSIGTNSCAINVPFFKRDMLCFSIILNGGLIFVGTEIPSDFISFALLFSSLSFAFSSCPSNLPCCILLIFLYRPFIPILVSIKYVIAIIATATPTNISSP